MKEGMVVSFYLTEDHHEKLLGFLLATEE